MNIKKNVEKHLSNISRSLSFLNEDSCRQVCQEIKSCKGYVYFTGIGKNGHIAQTAASTFASIGIKSIYIDAVDAVHGDMGIITDNDIIFAVSKSGNTEELFNFLGNVKQKNVKIISLHSNIYSKLQDISSISICLPEIEEADNFNIVPTVSIASYIIILQSIGLAIAEEQNFNLKVFKQNHPGGSIGKFLKNES